MKNVLILHHALGLTLLLLLSACGSAPTDTQRQAPTVDAQPIEEPSGLELPSAPVQADNEHLLRATDLLAQRALVPAAAELAELDPNALTDDEYAQYLLLKLNILYSQGDIQGTNTLLAAGLERTDQINPVLRQQLQGWQLRLMREQGNLLQAARLGASRLPYWQGEQEQALLRDQIWLDLLQCNRSDLQNELSSTRDTQWRGWLERSLLDNVLPSPLPQQLSRWQNWETRYPEHPAANISSASQWVTEVPARVALLLPLSGPLREAGMAVADGYMAAMLGAQQQGWPQQSLQLIDVADFQTLTEAYQAAADNGAEIVIGPLSRERLAQWRQPLGSEVPMLALNWLQSAASGSGMLYQFGLAPEDEAEQLARLAHGQGARKAMVIRPDGSFGDNMYEQFSQTWQQSNGELSALASYSDPSEYSKTIETALNLADSNQRATRLRQVMDTRIEFYPRRRQDIDSVILLASEPQDARAVKPLLAFHYAGDLPVYASSYVISDNFDSQRDSDLNGLQVLSLPWTLMGGDQIVDSVRNSEQPPGLAPMHALGADSFLLHWQLIALQADPRLRVRGYTGLLSMDAQGRLHRSLKPAVFRRGAPQAQ